MPWRPRAVSNSSPHPRVLHRPFLCLGLGPRRLTRPAQSPFQVIRCPGHRRRRRRHRTRRTRTRTRTSEASRWSFRLRQPHPHHSRHSSRRRGAVAFGAEAEAGSSARPLGVATFYGVLLCCFHPSLFLYPALGRPTRPAFPHRPTVLRYYWHSTPRNACIFCAPLRFGLCHVFMMCSTTRSRDVHVEISFYVARYITVTYSQVMPCGAILLGMVACSSGGT